MVPHIDYFTLDEYYTIHELCDLLNMDKQMFKDKCAKYSVSPRRNEIGEWGFVKYDVRKLHNALYHAQNKNQNDDPWA